jgi:hypothetical protein
MNLMPTTSIQIHAPALRDRAVVRAAQDSNISNMLGDRRSSDEAVFQKRSAGRRRTDPSRFGTPASDPLWDGPRLRPTFVAQVLGQVLSHERTSAMAGRSYGAAGGIAPGSLLDRGV